MMAPAREDQLNVNGEAEVIFFRNLENSFPLIPKAYIREQRLNPKGYLEIMSFRNLENPLLLSPKR